MVSGEELMMKKGNEKIMMQSKEKFLCKKISFSYVLPLDSCIEPLLKPTSNLLSFFLFAFLHNLFLC